MKKKNIHIKPGDNRFHSDEEIFSKVSIGWRKSKDEAWQEITNRIDNSRTVPEKSITMRWLHLSVAATILILLGISAVMWFTVKSFNCPAGEHMSINLPDNSTVTLNAQSELTYKPLWWRFSRTVNLNGEAFFEVTQGNRFVVLSSNGITEVLGTSFNIYSRGNEYVVACAKGKVKVMSLNSSDEVILAPNEKARLNDFGELEKIVNIDVEKTKSWTENRFYFTSASLNLVFEEISRQYNVKITVSEDINYLYTGYFSKNGRVEDILSLVCKPFAINFIQNSQGDYIISKNNK